MPLTFIQSGPLAGGRLTIWRLPRANKPVSLGLDFAYGLESGDFDAGVGIDCDHKQVFTIVGHWGDQFEQILWPIIQFYQPFIVGERQVGLPILRRLYDRGYGWLYFDRDPSKKGNPVRDKLGHHAHAGDLIIPRLRSLIAPRDGAGQLLPPKLEIYDAEVHGQLCKFGFQRRSEQVPLEGAHDAQYKMGAPHGEHDDLVMATAYAVAGIELLPMFEKPKEYLPKTTIGGLLGWDRDDEPNPSRWAKKQRA